MVLILLAHIQPIVVPLNQLGGFYWKSWPSLKSKVNRARKKNKKQLCSPSLEHMSEKPHARPHLNMKCRDHANLFSLSDFALQINGKNSGKRRIRKEMSRGSKPFGGLKTIPDIVIGGGIETWCTLS
jgi:hypothetical protein